VRTAHGPFCHSRSQKKQKKAVARHRWRARLPARTSSQSNQPNCALGALLLAPSRKASCVHARCGAGPWEQTQTKKRWLILQNGTRTFMFDEGKTIQGTASSCWRASFLNYSSEKSTMGALLCVTASVLLSGFVWAWACCKKRGGATVHGGGGGPRQALTTGGNECSGRTKQPANADKASAARGCKARRCFCRAVCCCARGCARRSPLEGGGKR
jgi:hypothetical protein